MYNVTYFFNFKKFEGNVECVCVRARVKPFCSEILLQRSQVVSLELVLD